MNGQFTTSLFESLVEKCRPTSLCATRSGKAVRAQVRLLVLTFKSPGISSHSHSNKSAQHCERTPLHHTCPVIASSPQTFHSAASSVNGGPRNRKAACARGKLICSRAKTSLLMVGVSLLGPIRLCGSNDIGILVCSSPSRRRSAYYNNIDFKAF